MRFLPKGCYPPSSSPLKLTRVIGPLYYLFFVGIRDDFCRIVYREVAESKVLPS